MAKPGTGWLCEAVPAFLSGRDVVPRVGGGVKSYYKSYINVALYFSNLSFMYIRARSVRVSFPDRHGVENFFYAVLGGFRERRGKTGRICMDVAISVGMVDTAVMATDMQVI